jgi:hypothetical protein
MAAPVCIRMPLARRHSPRTFLTAMTIREAKKPLSVGCQLAGCLFVALGISVWLWWRPYSQSQGVVRMEKRLVRGEEVFCPVVYPVQRGELWVADAPSHYREGDIVTVMHLKASFVKPPVSIWNSPTIDFVIGAVFLLAGWGLARRRPDAAEGHNVHERAV